MALTKALLFGIIPFACACNKPEFWLGSVAVSISACHAEGREFKSRPSRQNSLKRYHQHW